MFLCVLTLLLSKYGFLKGLGIGQHIFALVITFGLLRLFLDSTLFIFLKCTLGKKEHGAESMIEHLSGFDWSPTITALRYIKIDLYHLNAIECE